MPSTVSDPPRSNRLFRDKANCRFSVMFSFQCAGIIFLQGTCDDKAWSSSSTVAAPEGHQVDNRRNGWTWRSTSLLAQCLFHPSTEVARFRTACAARQSSRRSLKDSALFVFSFLTGLPLWVNLSKRFDFRRVHDFIRAVSHQFFDRTLAGPNTWHASIETFPRPESGSFTGTSAIQEATPEEFDYLYGVIIQKAQ